MNEKTKKNKIKRNMASNNKTNQKQNKNPTKQPYPKEIVSRIENVVLSHVVYDFLIGDDSPMNHQLISREVHVKKTPVKAVTIAFGSCGTR